MIRQALLRPRLNVGIFRVHDGSLRSTGPHPQRQSRMCHRGGRVGCCSGVCQSSWTPHSHFTWPHAMPAPRTPSRAIGSAPIYSFGRLRQSAGVG
jgi:hypothetical protein